MRLIHLQIHSYGIFRNQEFDFGSGRFQLICGPNEAGKSTLLQAIRETLFGFPHQTRYQLFDDEMAATAKLVLSDGRELHYRRRKGRKDPVTGELSDGTMIDERGLSELLGASLPLFQSVFAFSLDELSAGQKGLEQAQLTEALFGGAIGGLANFQRLQRRMKQEAESLFTPRAQKRPINSKMQRIEQLQQQLETTAAEPQAYQRERAEHQRLVQQIERADRQILQLRDAHQEAKRMCEAWEPFQQLTKLRHQQTGAGELQLTAEQWEAAKKLSLQREQLQAALAKQGEVVRRREAERKGLANSKHDEILAQQANVQALQQETSRMREFADQLPRLERQMREAQDDLHDRLRSLAVSWSEDRLEQVPSDRQLQKRLADAARDVHEKRRQLNDIEKTERELRRELTRVKQQLPHLDQTSMENAEPGTDDWEDDWEGILNTPFKSAESAVDETGPSEPSVDESSAPKSAFGFLDSFGSDESPPAADAADAASSAGSLSEEASTWESLDSELSLGETPDDAAAEPANAGKASPYLNEDQRQALELLLEQDAAYVKQCSERDALRRSLDEQRGRIDELEARMRAMGDWNWEAAPASPTTLIELSRRWRDAEQELRAAKAALADMVATGEDMAAAAQAQAAHAPPDDETLRQLRARRDEAWSLIRSHFIDRSPQEEAALERFQCTVTELADRYAQFVARADEAADVRQDQASVVAEMKSRKLAIRHNAQRQATAKRRCESAQTTAAEIAKAWQSEWPGGPEVGDSRTQDWYAARSERDSLAGVLAKREQQWKKVCSQTDAYESRLQAAVSAVSDVSAMGGEEADFEAMRADVRERLRRHQRWLDQSERLRLDHEKLTAQHDEASRDLQRIQASVRQAEHTWVDLKQQLRVPDAWEPESVTVHLSELDAAKSALARKRQLEKSIAEMRHEMEGFRQRVQRLSGDSELDRPAIEQLNLLAQRLSEAQESKQLMSARQQEDQRQQHELERLQAEQARCQQAWQKFIAASAAASEDAFVSALEGASVHQQLRAAEAQVHTALACDRSRLTVLMSELEQSSERMLRAKLEKAEEHLRMAEQTRNQLHRQEGAARERLQRLDGSDQAAVVEMERQSQLAEFSELVDRWAPLVLASRLMDQALERFERSHQPALLADVGDCLRRMTGGAYVEVKRQLGRSRSLVVVDQSGEEKTPEQLSKGTREQLYLAIRVAYVRKYCQSSEPLPLIMDDVLVNFDEERARRTIEVLLELSDEVQVLMMTCHRRTAKLIHQESPGTQPILLSNAPGETLDSWIAEEKAPQRRRRRRTTTTTTTTTTKNGPTQGHLFQ